MTHDQRSKYIFITCKRNTYSYSWLASSRLLGELRKLSHKKSKTGSPDESRILVFVLYKKEATRVENMLHREGFTVGGIHGDLSQNARMEALQNFKTGVTGLLVATDVAARGLDIPNG